VLNYTRLESLASDKHSGLLGPFLSYEKIKCCEIWIRSPLFETVCLGWVWTWGLLFSLNLPPSVNSSPSKLSSSLTRPSSFVAY